MISFNLKKDKYHLKNYETWSCKMISFNLKNDKCHLKNDKKWSCIAGFRNIFFYKIPPMGTSEISAVHVE